MAPPRSRNRPSASCKSRPERVFFGSAPHRITALKEVKAAGAHLDNTGAISHESHRSPRRKSNLRALLRAGRIGQDHQTPNGAPEPTVCHLKLYCAGLCTCYADLPSATVVWQSSARTPRPLMQMPVRRAKTTLARNSD